MTKKEFIDFLNEKASSSTGSVSHFVKMFSNSDDYWNWYRPGVDWLEDDINLSTEGKVVFTYDKSLGDDTSIEEEYTYEDFIEKFYYKNNSI